MMQQMVKLARLKTEDGRWNFEKAPVKVGTPFWINCNSFKIQEYRTKEDENLILKTLMVETEAGTLIPAELLEYVCEFRISQ